MTQNPAPPQSDSAPPPQNPPPRPPGLLGPTALWLAIQLAALALAAAQIPLSARYPAPAERLALPVLLTAQLAALALLCPLLCRTITQSIVTAASAAPFVALASFLSVRFSSADERSGLLILCGFVAGWSVALGLLMAAIRSAKWRQLAAAAFTAWTLGGAMLGYLHREFGSAATGTFDLPAHAPWSPVVAALAFAFRDYARRDAWITLAAFAAASLTAWGLSTFLHLRGKSR